MAPDPERESFGRRTPLRIALAAAIVVLAFAIFSPTLHAPWMWDDVLDITRNALLRSAGGLWRIWFHPAGLYDYYPLKFTVQWLQWHAFGNDTLGYHVTNIALHATSALLFWRILRQLGVRHGWIGAFLFCVHPLGVQSVAWINELKNTLSLPLFLGSFVCYLRFDASRRTVDYVFALALFAAALLCKTSVVLYPVVLLVFAWWRHGRIDRPTLMGTLPFAVLAVGLGAVTWWFQRHVAIAHADAFTPIGGPVARVLCAGTAAVFYLAKIGWPTALMPIYPQWPVTAWWAWLAWPALAAVAAICWCRRETWGRHALFGFATYLLLVLPVLGLISISSQRFSWVLDHLAYAPMLGILGLAAALLSAGIERRASNVRAAAIATFAGATALLAALAHGHALDFRSEAALWTENTRRNPQAWLAWFSLAKHEQEAKDYAAAERDYAAAIAARADYADAYYNLGNLRRETGRAAEAIQAYRQAIRFDDTLSPAHANLAVLLAQAGQLDAAIAESQRAVSLEPEYTEAHYNLGSLLIRAGRPADAVREFDATLRLDPQYPAAENNYAIALASTGHLAEAIDHYRRAAAAAPGDATIRNNLGAALRALHKNEEALVEFTAATKLRPDYTNAWLNLGTTYAILGHGNEALDALQHAAAASPQLPEPHLALSALWRSAGNADRSRQEYEIARQLRPSLPAWGK